MFLDSGICRIYRIETRAEPGGMPGETPVFLSACWYGELTIGVTRFYKAMQQGDKVDALIRVWQDKSITASCLCVLEDGLQYRVRQVQHKADEDGLLVSDLALERMKKGYELKEDTGRPPDGFTTGVSL